MNTDFLYSGHPPVTFQGSEELDLDCLPDLIEQANAFDSNGSEVIRVWEDQDFVHVEFQVYEREFENGSSYDDRTYELVGTVSTVDNGYGEYQIFNIEKAICLK